MQSQRLVTLGAVSLIAAATVLAGCRGRQYGHIVEQDQSDLVGSHSAGAQTFNPLIDESVGKLLSRQQGDLHPASFSGSAGAAISPKRICFIGVENRSIEELGDFKEQIYEQIDSKIVEAQLFEPVNRRFVDAALRETRLRPDSLFVPDNMRRFASLLERQGQPFDYLMYAKLTSGTTEKNHDYQRDYLLTLELIDVHSGRYDKESAKVRKGYHKSRIGKWRNYNPFTKL